MLRQLTATPRSRAQLEQALRRKDCPDDVAAAVLDRMEEVGLVDDVAYAGMLVRSQQAGRGLARRALAHELRRKGVDDDTARAALDEVDPHDEEERARQLVAKKLRSMSGLDPVVQTRRLAGMLARKGYGVRRRDAGRARGGPRGARAPARLERVRGSGRRSAGHDLVVVHLTRLREPQARVQRPRHGVLGGVRQANPAAPASSRSS